MKFADETGIARIVSKIKDLINAKVDKSGDTMSGQLSITAPANQTWLHTTNPSTGVGASFGVGSGGTNHGVWSDKLGKWIDYATASKVYAGTLDVTSLAATKTALGLSDYVSDEELAEALADYITSQGLADEVAKYLPLAGGTMTGSITFNAKNIGILATDSAGFVFPAFRDNGSNLWIGATATAARHHTGGTYISAGWNKSTSAGFPSIYVSVPNAANTNATNYEVYHKGNLVVQEWGNADFTYSEGFAAYNTTAGNTQEPRASKWGRVVNLTGAFKTTVARDSTAAVVIGKVPAGCEPLRDVRVRQQGTGQNSYLLVVSTNGNMSMERYGVATNVAPGANVWLNINMTYISKA